MRKLAIAFLLVAGVALTGSAFAQSAAPAASPAPAAKSSHHAKSSTHHKSSHKGHKGTSKNTMPATTTAH